jgi:hypothetical protein
LQSGQDRLSADLHKEPLKGEVNPAHNRGAGAGLVEELCPGLARGRSMSDIGEEDVERHHVIESPTGCRYVTFDMSKALAALLKRIIGSNQFSVVEGDLAGNEQQVALADAL